MMGRTFLKIVWALMLICLATCGGGHEPSPADRIDRSYFDSLSETTARIRVQKKQEEARKLVADLRIYEADKYYEELGRGFEGDRIVLRKKYGPLLEAQKRVAEDPLSAEANFGLGKEYYAFGTRTRDERLKNKALERAKFYLKKAISLDPGYQDSYILLERVLKATGKEEEFPKYVKKMEKLEELRPDIHLFLGRYYLDEDRISKALEHLVKVPSGSSVAREAAYYTGLAYMRLGKDLLAMINFWKADGVAKDAEDKFRILKDGFSKDAPLFLKKGREAFRAENYILASEYLAAAIIYFPDDIEANHELAKALEKTGDPYGALERHIAVIKLGMTKRGFDSTVFDSISDALRLSASLESKGDDVRDNIVSYFQKKVDDLDKEFLLAYPSQEEIRAMAQDQVLFHTGTRKFMDRLKTLKDLYIRMARLVAKCEELVGDCDLKAKDYRAQLKYLEILYNKDLHDLRQKVK